MPRRYIGQPLISSRCQYWMIKPKNHFMWNRPGFWFQCENCDLHFRHKSQLRLHLRQKHGAVTNTKVQYRRSRTDLPVSSLVTSWKNLKLFRDSTKTFSSKDMVKETWSFTGTATRKAIRKYRCPHGSLWHQCRCLLIWWSYILFLKYEGLVHQHILVHPS